MLSIFRFGKIINGIWDTPKRYARFIKKPIIFKMIKMKNPKGMSKVEVLDFFNTNFGDYDKWISRVVPYYDELQSQIVRVINCFYPKTDIAIDVLELGLGSGTTANNVLSVYPKSHLTGIEFSDGMIGLAEKKLRVYKDRIRIQEGDFMAKELTPEEFNVIISSLSVHHYSVEEVKKLFRRLHTALKQGGVFINADIVKFRSNEYSRKAHEIYLDFLREQLDDEFAIKVWERHIELQDKPMPLEDLLLCLKEVGYKDVSVSFRYWGFAVYSGRK